MQCSKSASFQKQQGPLATLRLAIPLLGCVVSTAMAGEIANLGNLPGGTEIYPAGLSGDGKTVVGTSFLQSLRSRAFRWTAANGVQDLGAGDPATVLDVHASAVNADGSVIFGDYGGRAFRWTVGAGAHDLPLGAFETSHVSYPTQTSGDGAVVVGYLSDINTVIRPFRWTDAAGAVALPTLAGFTPQNANGISADGLVIVGSGGGHAYRYTAGGGYLNLGVSNGFEVSGASNVSGDGQTVIGTSTKFGGGGAIVNEGFRWTAATGLVPLPLLPAAASYDGSTIVGRVGDLPAATAFLWTPTLGAVDLNTYLPALGVDLTGWNLQEAIGVSYDGGTLAGYGTYNGQEASWIVTGVPEPGTLTLLIVAAPLLGARRRRGRPSRWGRAVSRRG